MKATEQYFPVLLFIILYNVVLTLEFDDKIVSVIIWMKDIQHYFFCDTVSSVVQSWI